MLHYAPPIGLQTTYMHVLISSRYYPIGHIDRNVFLSQYNFYSIYILFGQEVYNFYSDKLLSFLCDFF